MDRITQLTNQYLSFAKERDNMNKNLEFLGEQLAKEKYPYEKGQKVLVRVKKNAEFVPAYFNCAVTHYYANRYTDKQELSVTPHLWQAKKDGTISSRSVYISPCSLEKGEVEIKPFEENDKEI